MRWPHIIYNRPQVFFLRVSQNPIHFHIKRIPGEPIAWSEDPVQAKPGFAESHDIGSEWQYLDFEAQEKADGVFDAMAELPSVVLSGPCLRENKFYGTCEAQEMVVLGELGYEVVSHRPPFPVDLEFTLTVASNSTVELLNLMAATATFLNRKGPPPR